MMTTLMTTMVLTYDTIPVVDIGLKEKVKVFYEDLHLPFLEYH